MAALTEVEARTRAGLLDVDSYEVFLDLTVQPVRSRTETRFRCQEPGAASFADLAAGSVLGAARRRRAGRGPERRAPRSAGGRQTRFARTRCGQRAHGRGGGGVV